MSENNQTTCPVCGVEGASCPNPSTCPNSGN